MANRRIVFTFDPRARKALERVTKDGKFSSMADAIRAALAVYREIQWHAKQGYGKLVVEKNDGQRREIFWSK